MLLPNVYKLGYMVGEMIIKQFFLSSSSNDYQEEECEINSTTSILSIHDLWNILITFPFIYQRWWLQLFKVDPIHVVIETTLLVSIVTILILNKQKDWKDDETTKNYLSSKEKQELLFEWKQYGRSSLAGSGSSSSGSSTNGGSTATTKSNPIHESNKNVIVHSMNGRTMDIEIQQQREENDGSSTPTTTNSTKDTKTTSMVSQRKTVLNFATFDFLGMSCSKQVKDASREALAKYGCGSCGPRGFYGTIDVHLQLEQAMAEFTKTDGAIMYSDGASTVSSTVAAFAKRGDLLVVDDGVYEPLVTGVTLSRANVKWFKHNDMSDLRRVLQDVERTNKSIGRKTNAQRRFIVVEGLYKDSGTLCPFNELISLKHEYHYRIILDESFSFGTLGKSGILDLYNKRYMYDAEIVTISLENALGSIGGVTVGNEEIVDHQRLSGAGYCFSASCPPFTASAALSALQQMQNNIDLQKDLKRNVQYIYQQIKKVLVLKTTTSNWIVTSDEQSPIVFLELSDSFRNTHELSSDSDDKEMDFLLSIQQYCMMEQNIATVVVPTSTRQRQQQGDVHAAIRINVSTLHQTKDIDGLLNAIVKGMEHCCSTKTTG